MGDMSKTIIPKSDQLNADDLLTGPITIKVTGVTVRGGQEQPVSISYEGDNGKPYKACKSMCRVMVAAWGADSSKYVGRSMTLFCDPKVKWGGMEVGGIRISHMSHIDENMTMALTVTRANKKPFTVRPLTAGAPSNAAVQSSTANTLATAPSQEGAVQGEIAQSATITPDQATALEVKCNENDIPVDRLKVAAKVTRLAQIKASDYSRAVAWLDKAIAAKKGE